MPRSTLQPDRPAAHPPDGSDLPPLGGRSLAKARSATLFRVEMMTLGAKRRMTFMMARLNAAVLAVRGRR